MIDTKAIKDAVRVAKTSLNDLLRNETDVADIILTLVGALIFDRNALKIQNAALKEKDAEIARLRLGHEALRNAVDAAIRKTDQPNRVILKNGEVIEGEAADLVHRILTLVRSVADTALTAQEPKS